VAEGSFTYYHPVSELEILSLAPEYGGPRDAPCQIGAGSASDSRSCFRLVLVRVLILNHLLPLLKHVLHV
jgi:hypothetical protein